MKIVVDANVVIAAFATHGLCHLVFETVLAHHEMVLSPQLLQEIQTNLKKKLKLPDERLREIMAFLKNHAQPLVKDRPVKGLACRDSDDIKILALALNARADVIVTGDQDRLVLKTIGPVMIVSPREFWDLLRRN
ncbi:putative toxin-antitoxin system toxin component, PIN family [Bdellovibrionota bacterium FG-2]